MAPMRAPVLGSPPGAAAPAASRQATEQPPNAGVVAEEEHQHEALAAVENRIQEHDLRLRPGKVIEHGVPQTHRQPQHPRHEPEQQRQPPPGHAVSQLHLRHRQQRPAAPKPLRGPPPPSATASAAAAAAVATTATTSVAAALRRPRRGSGRGERAAIPGRAPRVPGAAGQGGVGQHGVKGRSQCVEAAPPGLQP
eukprot:CAMPEP_0196771220 /NCGR_PEP_ID=MMETSP1104-20130614/1562_1 /TAXON_ID=33652 /ORGANISM="Cafeteria sp., Strain Caron Lab Isolate" /LENGTH=194 /DNA_ID=CAMNT_0042141337 /DNA_START=51 /DNA_END=631 /DNA_ORIENTATION=+